MFREKSGFKGICPICEDERDLKYGNRDEKIKVRDEGIDVEAKVYYCPEGDHYFYGPDDEEEKFQNAYREYRRRKGFLQPEEIKAIRNNYGLNQKEFAKFLGYGEITIQRYESGALQDDAHNGLLFLIRDIKNFKKLFEQRRDVLDVRIVSKIDDRLKEIEKASLSHLFHESSQRLKRSSTFNISLELSVGTYEKVGNYASEAANQELALAA